MATITFFGRSVSNGLISGGRWLSRSSTDLRRDGRKNDLPFHERELIADADAPPAAEGHVGEARQCGFALRQKAVGIEAQRIGKVARVAMQQPRLEK